MKAIVLCSGGIDSATTLYYARAKGYRRFCLTFDYGQRHRKEIYSARRLAETNGARWNLLKIDLPWKASALVDRSIRLPKGTLNRRGIPSTYVPGRNIMFLSFAVSYAEAIGAKRIFIGANQIDFSGYPDCRLPFLKAFANTVRRGTKAGAEGDSIKIEAPLIHRTKAEIIKAAVKLKVPLELTWSCYKGERLPCGRCDSCLIRAKGFKEAGVVDPIGVRHF